MAEIKKCTEEDIPQLFDIFSSVYKNNLLFQELEYFDWQFKNTPFCKKDEYSFLILKEGNKINSFIGYLPIEFRYNGSIHKGSWIQNWFSFTRDPSALNLLNKVLIEYETLFLIGFTLDAKRVFEAYKVPILNEIPRWIAILNPDKVSSLFDINDREEREKLDKSYGKLTKNLNSEMIYACDGFNLDKEFFFNNWSSIHNYCRRTGAYLNWRYRDIPKHNYSIIWDRKAQYVVYRVEKIKNQEESVIRILEWNFKGELAPQAISYILKEGKEKRSILMDFFTTATEIGAYLEGLGFLAENELNRKIPFLFRPIHFTGEGIGMGIDLPPHNEERSVDFSEWYITKGDCDIDRVKN